MPSRSRRRRRQQGSPTSAPEAESQQQTGRQGAPSTGIRGWLAGAGRWIGDKYDAATGAVGDFVHQTGQAAAELWDLASHSDLSLEGGNLVLDTDLDELMDVMPASVQGALQLDREASANRVRVVIDPGEKVALLTSDAITVQGLDTASLKTGEVRLQGVRIRLSNPGGGVPFLDGDFGFLGFRDAEDNLTAEVEVTSLTAADVVVQGTDGPATLASLQVDGLSGTAAAQGGAPMGDGAKTSLDFSVEGAVLEGLARQGISVSRAAVRGASGGMYEGSETAFLAADALSVSGATRNGANLGNAQVAGARVDVKNEGGGLVGLDDQADRLSGRVRVSTASVQDFDGVDTDLDHGSLGGVSVDFDSEAGTARAEAATARIQGLDTSALDVDEASVHGFGADVSLGKDRTTLRAAAGQARAAGVRFDGDAAAQAPGGGAGPGLDWGVDVADAAMTDVHAAGARVDGLQGRSLQAAGLASGDASWFMARADEAGVQGLDHELLSARGATLQGAGMDWHAGGDTNLRARELSLTDTEALNFSAGGLHASDGEVTLGPSGSARATLAQGTVTDARLADRVDVAHGRVDGVTATAEDGVRHVGLDAASLSGVRDTVSGGTVGSAELAGVRTTGNADGFSTRIEAARLADGAVSGHRVAGATAHGLSVFHDDAGARLTAEGGAATDIRFAGGGRVDDLTTSGVSASQSGGRSQLGVQEATASGITAQGVSAGSVAVQGAHIDHADTTATGFDGLQAESVAIDHGGTRASMASVDARGGRAELGGEGPVASLDQLSVLDARVASSGDAGGGIDDRRLLGSASRLIDDADVRGSVGLNAGDAGSLTVQPGTTASGRIRIQDNHIDQSRTHAEFSQPLAGPLWTSVSSVGPGDDGRLEADVNGWFDQDLAPKVNDSLGLQGDDLHSVGAMGTAATRPKTGSGGSAGGGTGAGSGGPGLFDTDSLRLQGDASFRAGTLDAGEAGTLTLDERQTADQNKVTFTADGRGEVVAGVADLLTRGFTTATDAGTLTGGAARVQDARVQSGADGTRASAARIDAEDLQLGGGAR
ncbi:MAG: hypothetical protein VX265_02810 [Myxococcota bacterium]|nr:hypothetical protein [Myxococcota bacterium]